MSLQMVNAIQRWIALSSDEKPAVAPIGSQLYETDTGHNFIWTGESWEPDLSLFIAVKEALNE